MCKTDNSLLFALSPLDHKHDKKGTVGKEEKEDLEETKTGYYMVRSTMPRQLLYDPAESVATNVEFLSLQPIFNVPT